MRSRAFDVAVIGMAGAFPGAPDLARYWANVVAGVDSVTEVDPARWPAERHWSGPADGSGATGGATGGEAPERAVSSPSKWGGFLPPLPFDTLTHGIPPTSLGGIETAQLLALETASRALADAGYAERAFDREATSVVFAAEAGTDLASAYAVRSLLPLHLAEIPAELDARLPRPTEDSFPGTLSNVIAGRVANRLDLGGPNYTVDAACASSLAALDQSCKELLAGTSDMVLCGAVDTHNGLHDYVMFGSVRALSPTGRCRPFDATADGIVLAEGVACLVLKRLADAERDGDRVYAVIKGVGAASDGRGLGLTAPRPEGQRRALERAYATAGVSPREVGLVEAHGTGTVLGDRTELETLTGVFRDAGAAPGSCSLGSVKSLIGHAKCAAGMAGLIKAVLAVHTGVRPPTRHISTPNTAWAPETSPFAFDTAARPWTDPERLAGVSAFGFGGVNYHAVLAAPPTRITPPGPDGPDTAPRKPELRPNATDFAPDGAGTGSTNGTAATGTGTTTPAGHAPRTPVDPSVTPASRPRPTGPAFAEWPAELLLFRGTDDEVGDALVALDRRLGDGLALRGLTGAEGTGPTRVAIVAEDVAGLRAQIARALRFEDAPEHGVHVGDGARTPVALLFPGQGSQRPGMLADLFLHFPRLHRFLRADPALTAAMFPPGTFGGEPPRLVDTRLAQPALGVGGLAALDLLRACGVEPDLAGGHSYGELVALAAAGVLPADAVLPLSGARAAAMHTAAGTDAGAMAAVAAPADTVAALLTAQGLADDVVLANHNAPDQVVLAGSAAGIDTAVGALRAAGRTAKRLPVAAAFHSARMAPAAAAFADALAAQEFRTPRIPVWSGATARPYPAEQDAARALLAGAPARPVRFAEQIEEMYAAGARVFVEAGPGTVLTRLVGAVLGDRPHTALSVEAPGRPGLPHLLGTLAALAVRGADVRPDALTDDRTDAPVAPNAGWTVDGHLVRTADGTPVPGGLRPAEPPVVLAAGGGERDETVIEFLRGTQRIVAAQQEVVLRYLGGGSTGSAPVTTLPGAPVTAAAPGRPGNVHGSVPAEPAAAGGPGAGAGPAPSVLELVARRTGYPPAMLDPDLDLEAGLGVDSLKRTEMAATLLGDAADGASVGALSDLRTIREMTDWLAAHTADGTGIEGGDSGGSGGSGDAGDASDRGGRGDAGDVADGRSSSDGGRGAEAPRDGHPAARTPGIPAGEDARHDGTHPAAAPRRHLVELVPAPLGPPGPGQRRARRATVSGGGRTGAELTVLLKERGTEVVDDPTGCDTFLLLDALDPFVADEPVLPARFADVRTAVLAGARTLLLATCHDAGPAGAGLHGLARAVAREYPDLAVVAVDLPAGRPPAEAARLLADELDTCGPATDRSVGHLDGRRARWRTTPVALPAGDVTAADLGLDRDSVVLLTGGARGITARIATALAERTGCHVELLGRSAPAADASLDEAALRERLIAGGGRAPADIEREVRGYAAAREVRQCLDALAATAASVRHHRADVRDRDRLAAVLDDVYARHGRLDTVVHAAGVVHDRTLRDKTPQAFAEVFGTKVDGARALAAQLRPGVRHLVLFGSIAGVLGNRGQSDYAAANDALDTLARRWTGRVADRVLALDWGPWAAESGGMVTAGLERAYARQGIGLIDPDAGVAAFLRELAFGHDPQVLHAAGDLDAFGDGLG